MKLPKTLPCPYCEGEANLNIDGLGYYYKCDKCAEVFTTTDSDTMTEAKKNMEKVAPIDEFKQRVQTILFNEYQIWAEDSVLDDIFDCAVWYALKRQ